MCVLLFKMAADLRRQDEDCVDELCALVFGQFLLGNMYHHSANEHVWKVITHILNTRTEKAFSGNSLILHIYIIIRKHYYTYFELIHAFYIWFWNNFE